MLPLEAGLQTYTVGGLREIAEHLGLKLDSKPPRKDWLITRLCETIPRNASTPAYVQTLTDAEQAALAVMVTREGPFTLPQVARPLMLAGMASTDNQTEEPFRPRARHVMFDLLHKGLIVNVATPSFDRSPRTLMLQTTFDVPAEVRSTLPLALLHQPTPQPNLFARADLRPAQVASRDLDAFLRELLFVWTELRNQPAQPLKSGGLGKRERRRLAEAVGFAEPGGLDSVAWLYEVLVALNLVQESGTEIGAVEGHAATLFWGAKRTQHTHDLRRAYVRMTCPLCQDRAAIRLTGYLQGLEVLPPSVLRERILGTLEQLATTGWIPFEFVMNVLVGGLPGSLMFTEQTVSVIYGQLHYYENTYRAEVERTLSGMELNLTRCALEELCTMGLVELGYASTEAVTPVAIRAMQEAMIPAPPAGPSPSILEQPWQMILQPDFQVLALGPVPLRVLAGLEQIARREKIDKTVITYRLTRDAVYRALQSGETVESITAYLEETTGQVIPQNIQRSLEEWYQQYERIVIRRSVRILQVDTPERLLLLLDVPELRSLLHPTDERTAWFLPNELNRVQQCLLDLELLPAASQGAQADLPNSMRWQGVELEPRTASLSLYVTGVLMRFAEPNGRRWLLTPKSIEKASTSGYTPSEIVATLKTLTGSALPADVEKHIVAWGKHFGTGQTAQVRLLRLKRSESLGELRAAEPLLHRWLRPLPGTENLAIVNEAHWDEVRALLASWGVDVVSERWW